MRTAGFGWLDWFVMSVALRVVFPVRGNAQSRRPVGPYGEGHVFEIEHRRWRPTLVSNFEVGGEDIPATPISPTEDLGLSSNERKVEIRGFLRLGRRIKLRASRVSFDYQASKPLDRSIAFAGIEFPEGAIVETTLDLKYLKWGAEVDLISSRAGYGFLAVVADYSSLEATPELTSAEAGGASSGAIRVGLGTLGAKCRIYLTPTVSVTAEASGMKWGGNVMTDLEGSIMYSLTRSVAISYGYRNHYTKWLEGSDLAVFRLRGYYFSLIVGS